MRRIVIGGALIATVLIGAEIGARYAGLVDFPLYEANSRIGYLPLPSQSGAFMGENDFYTNDLSMGVKENFKDTPDDLILVGDSLVWGGNPYRHAEKLGAQLQASMIDLGSDAKVWPISAGSWAIVNEVNWLEDHPQVIDAAETLIFVINSEDFKEPTSWTNPLTHPRSKPVSALVYLATKNLLKPKYGPAESDMLVPPRPVGESLSAVITACRCTVEIWLHPTRAELETPPSETALEVNFSKIAPALPEQVSVHRVRDIPGWSQDLYRDSIHPTPEGMSVLGRAIAANASAEN